MSEGKEADGDRKLDRRPQQGGEAATTRFRMEDGDNMDVPATGGRLRTMRMKIGPPEHAAVSGGRRCG